MKQRSEHSQNKLMNVSIYLNVSLTTNLRWQWTMKCFVKTAWSQECRVDEIWSACSCQNIHSCDGNDIHNCHKLSSINSIIKYIIN